MTATATKESLTLTQIEQMHLKELERVKPDALRRSRIHKFFQAAMKEIRPMNTTDRRGGWKRSQ